MSRADHRGQQLAFLIGGPMVNFSFGSSSAAMEIAAHVRPWLVAAAVYVLGAVAAHATPITLTGSYSIGQTGTAQISDVLATPFTLSLDVGIPSTVTNFFNETETAAQKNTITASFTFTVPSSGTGSISAIETFSVTGNARHDTLAWSNGGLTAITFADGAVLDISLSGESFDGARQNYRGLSPTIIFDLVAGDPVAGPIPAVPEPATLSLLGVLLVGLGIVRRRNAA